MAYWLFKSEPSEFSIDDLRELNGQSEPWDGIRNYQARNLLRDKVKEGDEAFIYHSSCKLVGIAGIARVIKPGYPDPAQYDPNSRYYDSKSDTENPRWFCVDVVFVRKFSAIIPLKFLKSDPRLSQMALIRQGRLSIQPVTSKEWQIINKME